MSDKKPPSGKPDAGPTDAPDDKTEFWSGPPAGDDVDDDRTRISQPQGDDGAAGIAPLPAPDSPSTIKEGATALGIGTTINNNYRIEEVLKAGGMGEVYRGIEIGTGDPVAIKAILANLAEDEKAGLLFKREARTLRQLSHEAIVRYYNYVHDRDLDQYFLVMEFIEGVPLADYLAKDGAMPPVQALTLLRRLSGGLARAHAQGVVHRDLSPDNVMLPDGDVGQARLIDFGIAKSNVVTEGTMHGQFAGKFKYVAPEQLGHYGSEIGPATDIYGLALLIAAATRGEALDMGASIVDAVQSRQSIPDLSSLPQIVQPILRYMLEPDPARRPGSMEDVQRMLDNPSLIPAHYRQGVTLPMGPLTGGPQTLTPNSMLTAPPQGLQVPMSTVTQTLQGTLPPEPTAAPVNFPAPEPQESTRALGLLVMAFLVICAIVGFGAWQMGMIGEHSAPVVAEPAQAESIPPPLEDTRAGFLAAFDGGDCTLLSRVTAGPNAGMIEGFSETGEPFAGLPVAYEEKFGARPAVLPRQVTSGQCAALAFTQALQGRGREPPRVQISADQMTSGEAITMRIGNIGDQSIWAALITPNSAVFNLTGRLSDAVGGERTLGFGLTLDQGNDPTPQLVLIVASDRPLTRAATAADNTPADELLPAVLDEIAARGGTASTTLGYVLLLPTEGD
ncbi:Serine/threonine kinase [Sulfitobacter noctilucae]|uniref:serine/threonine-protein kinase n=1 Tax=Sulfitobacter noctilucae TaxID=1342302 RepID=UPI00046A19BD|nr:serine/threonine-protein kinase [Sulfitobacter noctilucae]KIN75140.1 Serine/threonine kinase [Sulfitobacter noctilucae]